MADIDPVTSVVVLRKTFELVQGLATFAFNSRLTGQLNKAAFDLLAEEHDRGATERLAVAFMDLTGFKRVNDQHGHDAGDAAIKSAGMKLGEVALQVDATAYHLSGDEFVVVLKSGTVDSFVEAAGPLSAIEVSFEGKQFTVRANIGVARPAEDSALVLGDLRRRAEVACRLAKARKLESPLVWSAEEKEEELIDKRWRCGNCNATVTLLIPAASRKLPASFHCVNCGELLPD